MPRKPGIADTISNSFPTRWPYSCSSMPGLSRLRNVTTTIASSVDGDDPWMLRASAGLQDQRRIADVPRHHRRERDLAGAVAHEVGLREARGLGRDRHRVARLQVRLRHAFHLHE